MRTVAKPRVWFITGTSSGFGRALAELLLKNGEIVVATLRKPEALADLSSQYSSDHLLVLKLDLLAPNDISNALRRSIEQYSQIDVVVNNAAYGVAGEVEGVPEDVARTLFDVNFWAPVQISKEAIKIFRDVNQPQGGLLIQISSMMTIQTDPVMGYYSASKSALEGISETLAKELDPKWNIHVTMIQPGWFRTSIIAKATYIAQPAAYKNSPAPNAIRHAADTDTIVFGDVTDAAEKIYRLAELPNPPLRFPLGRDMVAQLKSRAGQFVAIADEYESWSEDLGTA